MPSPFDTERGQLRVVGHIALRKGITFEEVVADCFEFVRETDLRSGLKIGTTTPQVLAGHTACLSMEFMGGMLRAVNFALGDYQTGDMERDLESMFVHHNEFLEKELGMPDKRSTFEQSYRFSWGGIASLKDTRNGTSYIYVSWRMDAGVIGASS